MTTDDLPDDMQELVAFHGHLCPGLTIGYRAAKIGMARLGSERAEDEELIAIVENDSCSVDAVQALTGCTFGKGNLFFNDHGKQVFTFALRPSGRAVRVSLKPAGDRHARSEEDRSARVRRMLASPDEDLFSIKECTIDLPDTARIHKSVRCEACGESVMETRTRQVAGKTLCMPCASSA